MFRRGKSSSERAVATYRPIARQTMASKCNTVTRWVESPDERKTETYGTAALAGFDAIRSAYTLVQFQSAYTMA